MNQQLSKFLHFNDTCPVCEEPLTLYSNCSDKMLWKAKRHKNEYHFEPYKLISEPFNQDDRMILSEDSGNIKISFQTLSSFKNEIKTWNMNFFYLCNKSGLNIATSYFDLNAYNACYFRSTPWMEFKWNNSDWSLKTVNPDHDKLVVCDESFCFKQITPELEKVYIMNLDYETSKTRLWHYSANAIQRDDSQYEPKVFEKEMPLLSVRPKFEQKEKLIDRLDSWILIS